MKPTTTETLKTETLTPAEPQIAAMPDPARDLLGELNTALRKLALAEKENALLTEERKALDDNSFIAVMRTMDAGSVLSEAGAQIEALNVMVMDRQEKGVLTLKIEMKPLGNKLVYAPQVKVSEPKVEPKLSVFYVGDGGKPQRDNPAQRELPLR